MIVKVFNIDDLLKSKKNLSIVLIYGPNEGLIREIIIKLISSFKSNQDVDEISINGRDFDNNINLLSDEVKTFSMFTDYKIIQIENLKDKDIEYIADIEANLDPKILIIVKENNLNKNSKIRSFFEKSKISSCVACYEDDLRSTMNIIQKFQSDSKIKFNSDIKNYLLSNLSTDRFVSLNELEKIYLLQNSNPNKDLSLDQIKLILNDSSNNNIQKIVESVMYGKINKVASSVHKVFTEGINSIAVIRSLLNYLIRIHSTQIELKKKKGFEDAIKIESLSETPKIIECSTFEELIQALIKLRKSL